MFVYFLAYVTPGVLKGFSQFGPAVWAAIANIFTNIYKYEQRALLYRKKIIEPVHCSVNAF